MVRYSARAAKALGFLKKHYNDVEVYVEDTSSNNMWIKFLQNFIPEGVKLKSVSFLGGRENVIAACELDQVDDNRRRIYIIDGDFDFIRGKRAAKLRHLHRLPCYCVENLLVNHSAILDAAFTCCTNTSRSEISAKVRNLINDHEERIRQLFVIYATCEHLRLGLKTVKNGLHPFITKTRRRNYLDNEKIWRKIRELTRSASKIVGARAFATVRRGFSKKAGSLPIHKVASGKDFLLPFLWLKLKEIPDFSTHLDHFKVHLARSIHPARDPVLRRKFNEFAV